VKTIPIELLEETVETFGEPAAIWCLTCDTPFTSGEDYAAHPCGRAARSTP
jgi:hypothetical protein